MWLRDIWFFALASPGLGAGRMLHKTILGRPVLFGRKGGACTAIPSLVEDQNFNLDWVKVRSFPLRESRRSMHEKARDFAPSEQGFKMVRHRPASNSFAHKLLGGPS